MSNPIHPRTMTRKELRKYSKRKKSNAWLIIAAVLSYGLFVFVVIHGVFQLEEYLAQQEESL